MNDENKTLYYELIVHTPGRTQRNFIANNTNINIKEYVISKYDVTENDFKLKYLGDNPKEFSDNAMAEPIFLSRTEIYRYTNDKEAFYDMVMNKVNMPSLLMLDTKLMKQAS